MKATIRSTAGAKKGELTLPAQFDEPVRPDLIKRAVLAMQSHKRQPYGTDPEAGKKYSSKLSRRRRDYKTSYGIGISRVPRKILSYRGTRFNWEGATAPNTKGGRQAHPPKAEKKWEQKINKKERRKAIRSAMAASVSKDFVEKRGHKVGDYPIVLDDEAQNIDKTKDVMELLTKLGLEEELERSSKRTYKTGNARRRGRKYSRRKGPLFVVSERCKLVESASNIPGVDVITVESLNAELLAPGTDYGRLTVYTQGAIEKIKELNLFTDNPVTTETKESAKTVKPKKTSAKKASKPKASKSSKKAKKTSKPKAASKKKSGKKVTKNAKKTTKKAKKTSKPKAASKKKSGKKTTKKAKK